MLSVEVLVPVKGMGVQVPPRTRQIAMSSRSRACSVVTRVQPPAAAGSVPRFLPRRSSFHRPDAGGLRR
jgi:hypothetical protein